MATTTSLVTAVSATNYNDFIQLYNYDINLASYNSLVNINEYFVYFDESQIDNFVGNNNLPLHPQDYVELYSRDNLLNLNFVINYNLGLGSNIYLVYSIYEELLGKKIDNFPDFLRYVPSEFDLAEKMFTQSLFIKIDYWFDY